MIFCPAWKTRLFALAAALVAVCATSAIASVHSVTYAVGDLASAGLDDVEFSASWLHDASKAPNPGNGTAENGAYRTGKTSDSISGNLYGQFDDVENELTGIGGVLSGNMKLLFSEVNNNLIGQDFVLKLGKGIDANHNGALKFETNGIGSGQYSGGFIDFALSVGGDLLNVTGTFFFKPQAETGSYALSPNRGNGETFTLWGYNWMHDSGPIDGSPDTVNWTDFLASLDYGGDSVLRQTPGSTSLLLERTLGIALYVHDADSPLTYAANPEPTTFLVWGVLAMIGASYCRRERRKSTSF